MMNLAWFAAIAAFAATLAVVLLYKPKSVTAADLSRLAKGMTREEVVVVLGEPNLNLRATLVRDDPEEVWTYSLPASHWGVTKSEYQVKFYQGHLDSWWKVGGQ